MQAGLTPAVCRRELLTSHGPRVGSHRRRRLTRPDLNIDSLCILSGVEARRDPAADLAGDLISVSGQLIRLIGAQIQVPVSSSQARLLARLREDGPHRVTELARLERCTQPSMTAAVDRLERAGWVIRRGDDADGRAVLVEITTEGERQVLVARAAMAELLGPRLSRLDEAERDRLVECVELIRRMMADAGS